MRKELQKREGLYGTYSGTIEKFGMRRASGGFWLPTFMLVDVKDETGMSVCDHLWFPFSGEFSEKNLQIGDEISFHALVEAYEKGYKGAHHDGLEQRVTWDFCLTQPTGVRKC